MGEATEEYAFDMVLQDKVEGWTAGAVNERLAAPSADAARRNFSESCAAPLCSGAQ